MKEKRLTRRVTDRLELPPDALSRTVRVTLTDGQAQVENYASLLELTDTSVTVLGKRQMAVLEGADLELAAMTEGVLLVTGQIVSARLEAL